MEEKKLFSVSTVIQGYDQNEVLRDAIEFQKREYVHEAQTLFNTHVIPLGTNKSGMGIVLYFTCQIIFSMEESKAAEFLQEQRSKMGIIKS